MTFKEKEKKILENRGISLLGYSGSLQSKADLQEERDLNNKYLFGDNLTGELGVVNVLELIISELNYSIGRTTEKPELHNGVGSSKVSWTNQFEQATKSSGDNEFYLDVDPADGIGDQDINENTDWFQNNGYNTSQTLSGIRVSLPLILEDEIGSNALDASNDRTNYSPPDGTNQSSQSEQEAEAENRAEQDAGAGLLGKRTQNADSSSAKELLSYSGTEASPGTEPTRNEEITIFEYSYTDSTDPTNSGTYYYYKIGLDGVDHPHYFSGAERNNLINAIGERDGSGGFTSGFIKGIQDYISELESSSNELNEIATNNSLFSNETANMINDFDASSLKSYTDTNISNLNDIIQQIEYNLQYFEGFPSSESLIDSNLISTDPDVFGPETTTVNGNTIEYNENEFNDLLNSPGTVNLNGIIAIDTLPECINKLETEIDSRTSELESYLNLNDVTSGIRKWLVFWIKENINKPQSPYIGLNGIDNSILQAISGISKSNSSLISLFGENRDEWVPQPNQTYAYQNNIFDDDTGEVITRKNDFGWVGPVFINKAEIYRKEISQSNLTPDNTAWPNDAETDVFVINSFDPDTGMIPQIYTDDDNNIAQEQIYLYRVQVYDTNDGGAVRSLADQSITRLDAEGNSSSLQSKIYDDTNKFSFSGIVNGEFTFVDSDDKSDFSAGQFIAITETTSSNGFYRIDSITDKKITLINKNINSDGGSVSRVFGIVSIDV